MDTPDTTVPVVMNPINTLTVNNLEPPPPEPEPEPEPKSIPDNNEEIETLNNKSPKLTELNHDVISSINNNKNNTKNIQNTTTTSINITNITNINENVQINSENPHNIVPSDASISDNNNCNINNDESNDIQIISYKPPQTNDNNNNNTNNSKCINTFSDNNDTKNAEEDAIDNSNIPLNQIENNSNLNSKSENNKNTNHIQSIAIQTNNENNINNNQMDIDNEIESKSDIQNNNTENTTQNNNNFPIGTEQNNKNINNSKQEMDIDEPINECIVRRKKKPKPNPTTKSTTPKPQKTIEPPLIRGLEDYDEELDEDYNENDEEEEDEDDGSSHSEEIINDCDDESNPYSDLAHIELVDDNKLYTEEAPRWLVNPETEIDDAEHQWNCADYYENWELTKGDNYSEDGSGGGGVIDGGIEGDGFFKNLIAKYNRNDKCSQDPERDRIKRDNYKLDDDFINDDDCFDDNDGQTIVKGFHLTKYWPQAKKIIKKKKIKHKKIIKKTPNGRLNPNKLTEIPQTYKIEIDKIRQYCNNNKQCMDAIINNREMHGIVKNKSKYMKYLVINEEKNDNDNNNNNNNDDEMMDEKVIEVYYKLLLMLLELDTNILRDKGNSNISNSVKLSIYHQLAIVFGYDQNAKLKKQQNTFEELLNWFSYDWYDCKHEIQSKKINWRNLYLIEVRKRAKARFHCKMNKKRKTDGIENKKDRLASKYSKNDIPWDGIAQDLFFLTCYTMENAAINDTDIDLSRGSQQASLRDSISKYLVGGENDIKVSDIEKIYKQQKNQPFPTINHCYSYLITQRIKYDKRNNNHKKNRNKSPRKHSHKKHKENKSVVDLTNNNNKNNKNNKNEMEDIKIKLQPISQSPLPGGFFRNDNNNNNNNNNGTSGVIDLTNENTLNNTPIKNNTNNRKRTWNDLQSNNDELTQNIDHNNTNNSYNSPPLKKTKLMQNIHVNPTYQTMDDAMKVGSLIGVQNNNGPQYGLDIVVIQNVDSKSVQYVDYKTNKTNECEYNKLYYIIPYIDKKYNNSENMSSDKVFALLPINENEFDTKYMYGQIIQPPNSMNNMYYNDNGNIVIKYIKSNTQKEIPLATIIQSQNYNKWRNNKIPTVIKIIPVVSDVSINNNVNNNHNVNNNVNNNHNVNNNVNNNNNNNNEVVMIGTGSEPMLSHTFINTLPDDPWNDRHFAGGN